MKRFIALFLMLTIVLLTACSQTSVKENDTDAETTMESEAELIEVPEPLPEPTVDIVLLPQLEIGDTFFFGVYEQDGNLQTEPEPIEWRVLAKEDGRVMVISQFCLDAVPYDIQGMVNRWQDTKPVTWSTSFVRHWLNGDFLSTAFNSADQNLILTTLVHTPDYPEYESTGGPDTNDRIFLISWDELFTYFQDPDDRKAQGTPFYFDRRLKFSDEGTPDEIPHDEYDGTWCVRNLIDDNVISKAVWWSGECYPMGIGNPIGGNYYGIRPAMWLKTDLAE